RKAHFATALLADAVGWHGDFSGSDFMYANLSRADFSKAVLNDARLVGATLVETNFEGASLEGCQVYGVSAWGVRLTGSTQRNLVITPVGEPRIVVDNLEVAQFVYLLLNNEKIRDVLNTITSKS